MTSMSGTIGTHANETTSTRHLLVEEACLNLYRENAFRITGLPVDATAKEIARHSDKLKIMEELGQGDAAHSSAFALNPPPSVDQIREAIRRLRDPEKRLIDEFFWFWPMTIGNSASDPALQALMRGDPSCAYTIWNAEENNPEIGFVATHNIAVMCHLLAVEWTLYQIAAGVDSNREEEVRTYWREAFTRWKMIISNELVWDTVKDRIRSIDDARLTIGFGRRMNNSLPDALSKINAEAAVKFAEQGQSERARTHVDFMREPQQGVDTFANTAELALASARTRLKQQIERARERAAKNKYEALGAGRELLDHARQFTFLFELFFGKDGTIHNELSDEVATICRELPSAYHKTTGDHSGVLKLLTAALPFAVSSELKNDLQETIVVLMQWNIEDSKLAPKAKLEKVMEEIVPMLVTHAQRSNSSAELGDNIAKSVRRIGISAHNDQDDLETAMEATMLASNLARDPELKKLLAQDKIQLEENKSGRKQNTLFLRIRSDEIEVTREKVRYNSSILPSNDINGVRFGIYVRSTNGVPTTVSYFVAVSSANHGTIDIECKRFARSQEKAKADFEAIVTVLYYQIIPPLCSRLAKYITAGNRVPLGDCWMTNKGIVVNTGALLWKETQLIPWSDVRFHSQSGLLYIVASTQKGPVAKSFSHRDVWNAVILKELADAVVTQQGKQQHS